MLCNKPFYLVSSAMGVVVCIIVEANIVGVFNKVSVILPPEDADIVRFQLQPSSPIGENVATLGLYN